MWAGFECFLSVLKADKMGSIALPTCGGGALIMILYAHVDVFGCKGAEGHTHFNAMKKPKITSLSSCRIKFRQKASENTCRETRTAFIAALYCYTKVYTLTHPSIQDVSTFNNKKVLRNLRERPASPCEVSLWWMGSLRRGKALCWCQTLL